MIIPFYLHSVETGELLPGVTVLVSVVTRRNSDDSIDDLSAEVESPADRGGGLYEFEIPDALFTAGSNIDYELDCTEDTSERRLSDHLSSSVLNVSVDVPSSSVDFKVKRGDLLPAFERVLRDERGGRLDLSGEEAEVVFRMRPAGGGTLKINDAPAEIVGDGKHGRVRYVWEGTDTNSVGLFDAEFVVTDGPRTFPPGRYYSIEVVANLDD